MKAISNPIHRSNRHAGTAQRKRPLVRPAEQPADTNPSGL
jgi:hypothetical protein